jgi:hypothetical protein
VIASSERISEANNIVPELGQNNEKNRFNSGRIKGKGN